MRPYIPPEYDSEFASSFLRKERAGEDPDNLEPSIDDIDVTPRGLVARYSELLFPHIYATEITARAEQAAPEARHGAALLYLIRRSSLWATGLLLLIAVARGWPEWTVRLLPHIVLQTAACVVLHTLFGRTWSTSLGVLVYFAVLVVVTALVLGRSDAVLLLVLMMFVVGVGTADTPFQTALRATSVVIFSILAVTTGVSLAWGLPPAIALLAAAWSMLVLAKLIAQSGILWMASNRSASLDLVQLHLLPDFQSDDWTTLQSRSVIVTSVAYGCGVALLLPTGAFLAIVGAPSDLTMLLVLAVANIGWCAATHLANWLIIELAFHRRMPDLGACARSLYVAWRTLSVWIAYTPALRAPAVFQFPRPWSKRWLRLLLLNWAIIACGTLPIGMLIECIYLPGTPTSEVALDADLPSDDYIPGGAVLIPGEPGLDTSHSSFAPPPYVEAPPSYKEAFPGYEQPQKSRINSPRVFDYRFLIFAGSSAESVGA